MYHFYQKTRLDSYIYLTNTWFYFLRILVSIIGLDKFFLTIFLSRYVIYYSCTIQCHDYVFIYIGIRYQVPWYRVEWARGIQYIIAIRLHTAIGSYLMEIQKNHFSEITCISIKPEFFNSKLILQFVIRNYCKDNYFRRFISNYKKKKIIFMDCP